MADDGQQDTSSRDARRLAGAAVAGGLTVIALLFTVDRLTGPQPAPGAGTAPAASAPVAGPTSAPGATPPSTRDPNAVAAPYCAVISSELAESTDPAAARSVYAAIPPDARAGASCVPAALATLLHAETSHARAMSSAAASMGTIPQQGKARWDEVYAGWLAPTQDVALPAITLLLVLLGIARVGTRAVPADSLGWGRGLAGAIASIGLTIMVTAALWPTVLARWGLAEQTLRALARPLWSAAPRPPGSPLNLLELVTPAWVPALLVSVPLAISLGAPLPSRSRGQRSLRTAAQAAVRLVATVVATVTGAAVVTSGLPWAAHLPHRLTSLPGGTRVLGAFATLVALGVVMFWGRLASALMWAAALSPFLLITMLPLVPGSEPAVWCLAAGLGVAGVITYASGSGRALRLQLAVESPTDADALTAEFQALVWSLAGDSPKGLRLSQGTDVDALPTDALAALPESLIAKRVVEILRLALPLVPWRFTLSIDGDSAVVTARRNGQVASIERLSVPGLLADATPTPLTSGQRVLVSAAAAFVVVTLSQRHAVLRQGLSGATVWVSVARQVIATDPRIVDDPAARVLLLDLATTEDIGNDAAKVALLGARSLERNDSSGLRALSRATAALYDRLLGGRDDAQRASASPPPSDGTLPIALASRHADLERQLRSRRSAVAPAVLMRCAYLYVVTTLNHGAAILAEQPGLHPVVGEQVYLAVEELAAVVRNPKGPRMGGLAGRFVEVLEQMVPSPAAADCARPDAARTAPPVVAPLSTSASYARACTLAYLARTQPLQRARWTGEALPLLRLALHNRLLRQFAPNDPFLAGVLATADGAALLTPWPTPLTDLAPFSAHAPKLRELMVTRPQDLLWLLDGAPDAVRGELRLTPLELRRWQGIAGLVRVIGDNVDWLAVLLAQGVTTPEELRRRAGDDALRREIMAAFETYRKRTPKSVAPSESTVRGWA